MAKELLPVQAPESSSVCSDSFLKSVERFGKALNRAEKGYKKMTTEPEPKQSGWAVTKGTFRSVEDVRATLPPGLYTLDIEDGHKLYTPVTAPADEAVDLPGLPSKYLMDQIKLFWSRADRYAKYHLLQKRGILLYGEPGCGKTSLINLLTKDLINIGGVIFLIDDFATAAVCIQHFRSVEPTRPIMTVMEDIEGTFSGDQGNREVKAALSLLDGQDQVDNITHVATTNQPELLADRFIKRPGRFDLVIGIHAPVAETRAAYLKYITQGQISEEHLKELVNKTDGLSLAYLREIASTYLCLDIPIEETMARLQKNLKLKSLKSKNNQLGFSIGYEEGK
jgi:energy-coupling factor transporter ATP-binding protein EcfA2